MKFAVFVLLVAFVACSVEGSNWAQRTKNLEKKFENLVNRKAAQAVSGVKNAKYSLQKDVYKFFQYMESKINTTVASAIKDIDILKFEVSVECYTNATKEIVTAQEAALANLLACQNMSQAYQDIEQIAQQAQPIILDIASDVKVILAGVAECGTEAGLAQWKCAFKYVSEELQNLVNQWPDAKKFIVTAERLGNDVELQVNTCLDAPTQVTLEKRIKEAMAHFSSCSQQTMRY
ncbi:hypothetical protein GE061_006332 [Apolygus lucorum]|uniref:Uncharacterized protein n=1 Tax=Apolygus lucorum TaxID=248454 RepID=A0A6A4J271_APOLU|nr:hypothetical protein GE061_006332 [Apolygus lucorum]